MITKIKDACVCIMTAAAVALATALVILLFTPIGWILAVVIGIIELKKHGVL